VSWSRRVSVAAGAFPQLRLDVPDSRKWVDLRKVPELRVEMPCPTRQRTRLAGRIDRPGSCVVLLRDRLFESAGNM